VPDWALVILSGILGGVVASLVEAYDELRRFRQSKAKPDWQSFRLWCLIAVISVVCGGIASGALWGLYTQVTVSGAFDWPLAVESLFVGAGGVSFLGAVSRSTP